MMVARVVGESSDHGRLGKTQKMYREKQARPGKEGGEGRAWPSWAKGLASAALVFHMAAVLAAVAAAPPASEVERAIANRFAHYYELIDQGYAYRYYAPEPPPTAVVTARLRFADGRPEREVRIPDRSLRPRLLYQRHLALAHHLFEEFNASRNDPHGERPSRWGASYARHLCKTTPGCSGVTLYFQMHMVPDLEQVREAASRPGAKPLDADAEEFYTVPERIGDYSCDDF
jgi:hypothetical protein